MKRARPAICVLSATPLTVHFFLKSHLVELSRHFDVTLALNPKNDAYLPPLCLPVHQVAIGFERKIAPVRDLLSLLQVYKLFRRNRFDVVVSLVPKTGLLGMIAAFFARVPCRVHIFQGEVWAARRGAMRLLLKTTDWLAAHAATHVLAVSQSERRFLEEQGVVRPGQVQVLGAGSIGGVDMQRFRPDAEARGRIRKSFSIPDDAVVCVYLGRLTVDKGIFELVQAFAKSTHESQNLWLLMVGPDEDGVANELRSLTRDDVARRMVIADFTHEPESVLAAADFVCLPSHREGFGMVIVEAAAVGIPAIGSRIYGVVDAIEENRTGVLYSPRRIDELAEAITLLAKDPDLRVSLGNAAKQRVARDFEQGAVVARFVRFFRDLAAPNQE